MQKILILLGLVFISFPSPLQATLSENCPCTYKVLRVPGPDEIRKGCDEDLVKEAASKEQERLVRLGMKLLLEGKVEIFLTKKPGASAPGSGSVSYEKRCFRFHYASEEDLSPLTPEENALLREKISLLKN